MKNRISSWIAAIILAALWAQSAVVAAESSTAESPVVKKDGSLPPAKDLIDKFVKALGGKAAFEKVHSEHILGKYEVPAQGLTGQLEVFSAQPNKLLVNINIPALGKISSGYDGKTGWTIDPMRGPRLLSGKEKTQLEEEADFFSVLHDPKNFKSLETLDRNQFEGKECYKVRIVKKSGTESTEFYEAANGLLAGVITLQESELGPMMVTNVMNQYQKFGTLRLPSKMTQRIGPIEQVMTINSVEFNSVKDSAFTVPTEVKGLMKPESK